MFRALSMTKLLMTGTRTMKAISVRYYPAHQWIHFLHLGTPSADLIDDCNSEPTSLQLLRWDTVDENTNEADRIANIVSEIQNRYKDPCRVTPLLEYPTIHDAIIWRVRVKVRGFSLPVTFCVLANLPAERV